MAKEKYMALEDLQTVWTNRMKPWIVDTFIAVTGVAEGATPQLVLQDGSLLPQSTFQAAGGVATIDVKGLVKDSVIDERANRCSFTYDNVPVFSVPCVRDNANCTLVHANLIDEGLVVDKLYLIAGRTVVEVYDADDKPDWVQYYLPSKTAVKLEDMDSSLNWK